jgi:hypothetical protein
MGNAGGSDKGKADASSDSRVVREARRDSPKRGSALGEESVGETPTAAVGTTALPRKSFIIGVAELTSSLAR